MNNIFMMRQPTIFMNIGCSSNELPTWKPMERNASVMLYDVNPSSDEGTQLSSLFHKTLIYPDFKIHRIFRVQNPILWLHYALKKKQIEQDIGGLDADERRLFHGTYRDKLEAIVRQGFDWRIGKTHGKLFGNGTYFARDSCCAHEFTDCGGNKFSARWSADSPNQYARNLLFLQKPQILQAPQVRLPQFLNQPFFTHQCYLMDNYMPQYMCQSPLPLEETGTSNMWELFNGEAYPFSHFMIVARVLVGRYCLGTSGLQRPPPFDNRDSLVRLYDSCVDNMMRPEKFVIFDHNQAYPEYVIEYRDLRWNR